MAESLELLPEHDVSQLLLQQFHMNEFIWFFLFRVFSCAVFFSFFFLLLYSVLLFHGQLRKFSENKASTFMCKRELKRGEMDQRRRKSVWRKCTHELQSFHWLRSHTINLLFVLNLIQELLRLHYWRLYMHIYVMCIFDWKMF